MKLKVLFVSFIILANTILAAPSKQSHSVAPSTSDVSAVFKVINNRTYCTDVLPHDFSCMLQLLQHGKNAKKDTAYFERVFRLFTRLVKESPIINAYAFKDTIMRIPDLVKESIAIKLPTELDTRALLEMELADRFKGSVNSILYQQLLNNYGGFKKDPDLFLERISEQVTTIFECENNNTTLRAVLVRFLETCIAKLAWSPDTQELMWDSTKIIATHLKTFVDTSVVDDVDDLDDMYWSLIHRFCVFLDIFGDSLSSDFYTTVVHDITHKKLDLTHLEEQQEWLISKSDFLQNRLQDNKTRMIAFQNGILSR